MKCYYLVGYHGCGKTTQANLLETEFPMFNYVGGKSGLDAVGSVQELVDLVKSSTKDMVIHGCIFQTEPTLLRLSRLTDLHIIVMHSFPMTVEARTLKRGADNYNLAKFKAHYSFIKKLPQLKKTYNFKLSVINNNQDIKSVYRDIKKCVQS
jgi:adenylate kinase family enzyme